MDIENSAPNIPINDTGIDNGSSSTDNMTNDSNLRLDKESHGHTSAAMLDTLIGDTRAVVATTETASSSTTNEQRQRQICDNNNHLGNLNLTRDDSGDESIEYADAVDEEGASCFFSFAPESSEGHLNDGG